MLNTYAPDRVSLSHKATATVSEWCDADIKLTFDIEGLAYPPEPDVGYSTPTFDLTAELISATINDLTLDRAGMVKLMGEQLVQSLEAYHARQLEEEGVEV